MHFFKNFLIRKLLCSYQILDLCLLIKLHLMQCIFLIVEELVRVFEKLVVRLVLNLISYQLILEKIWIIDWCWYSSHQGLRCTNHSLHMLGLLSILARDYEIRLGEKILIEYHLSSYFVSEGVLKIHRRPIVHSLYLSIVQRLRCYLKIVKILVHSELIIQSYFWVLNMMLQDVKISIKTRKELGV